jgi:SAM-dependent methyltransferase
MEARAVDVVAALSDTQRAFDGVAPAYHESNVENVLLERMRRQLWRAVETYVARGGHLLDLGCGPGTDEVAFAARGYRVTAIDWSPAMVNEARRRLHAYRVEDRVTVMHLGIQEVEWLRPATFDAVCSNLGPLNCVPDLDGAARSIAERVRPGGVLIASVIGRVCPWEIALYAARRDWARLRVRFERGLTAVPLEGRTVWTRYYTPAAFERAFVDAGFAVIEQRAMGLFAPPPYLQAFADRHPRSVAMLQGLDGIVGGWPGFRAAGDHFLVVMRRQ